MFKWIAIFIKHRDRGFLIGIIKNWLANAISRYRGRWDDRLRILFPYNAVVRKGHTDTIIFSAHLRCGDVVHRIVVRLSIAKRILEDSSNYSRIAYEGRIPRSGGFRQN